MLEGKTLSCIVPAYNEEKNISPVLKVLFRFEFFDEIIVIDDGSQDNTLNLVKNLKKSFSGLKILSNKRNLGKTGAVKRGISVAKGDLIMTCDADLKGFKVSNIRDLINPVLKGEADLSISNRAGDMVTLTGYTNLSRFFCGERVFWKKDFLEIDLPDEGGYLLEVLMNLHYLKKNKKIITIYFDNLYPIFQFEKMDFWKGIRNYVKMYRNIWDAAELSEFLMFFLLIKNNRFGRIYDIYYPSQGLKRTFLSLYILFLNFLDGFYLFVTLKTKDFLKKF